MDIFALIVILVIIAAAIWIIVTLGSLPGHIAREKNHPQVEAINILGWIGILTLGIGWFAAIVWACVLSDVTAWSCFKVSRSRSTASCNS